MNHFQCEGLFSTKKIFSCEYRNSFTLLQRLGDNEETDVRDLGTKHVYHGADRVSKATRLEPGGKLLDHTSVVWENLSRSQTEWCKLCVAEMDADLRDR